MSAKTKNTTGGILALGVGLHEGIPIEQYIADPCAEPSLSAGTMHTLLTRSAAHARLEHPRLNPLWTQDHDSRAELGTAIHAAILGGSEIVYADAEYDDWRKGAVREWRDEMRLAGKIPLLARERPNVEGARDSVAALLGRLAPAKGSREEAEGTMIWSRDGVLCRGRFDLWYPGSGLMIDVKTCESAEPRSWSRGSLYSGGYDIQAEHYLDGIQRLLDVKAKFLFLLVEITPPHSASLVGLDEEFTSLAKRKIKTATRIWKECLESDSWPGFSAYPHWASPPPWALADQELRDIERKERS